MSGHRRLISILVIAAFSISGISVMNVCGQELAIKPQLGHVPPLYRQDTLTICFMGDVMMHTKQIETAGTSGQKYDFSSYFSLIGKHIADADIAIANMEFTLAGEPYSGYPCFSAPDSFAYFLAESGFDVFLAANNHILDKGSEGADRTVSMYRKLKEEKKIEFTGIAGDEEERAGNYPLMIRKKGMTLAIVNFTYGTNLGGTQHWPKTNYLGNRTEILHALESSENADLTIVLPHWGEEYQLTHSQKQEEAAIWLVENGADLIIGAHPHVVQDTTEINEVPVLYSLGNAVSNMSAPDTQIGLMVTVRMIRHSNGDIEMKTPELKWLWCSRPGGYNKSYTIIPVEEFIGSRQEWIGAWEYDKMMATYERIRKHN